MVVQNGTGPTGHGTAELLPSSSHSCDLRVVGSLRQRTLGNSSIKIRNQINEQHSELYMKWVLRFLKAREPFHVQAQSGLLTITAPDEEIPSMLPVPHVPWFSAVYVRDVMSSIDEVKANITSTFGSILKMD